MTLGEISIGVIEMDAVIELIKFFDGRKNLDDPKDDYITVEMAYNRFMGDDPKDIKTILTELQILGRDDIYRRFGQVFTGKPLVDLSFYDLDNQARRDIEGVDWKDFH